MENLNIDAVVDKLENGMSDPGTTISRVCIDNNLAIKEGCTPHPDRPSRESVFAWCVAVGKIMEPKKFYYGNTIADALEKAIEEELRDEKR